MEWLQKLSLWWVAGIVLIAGALFMTRIFALFSKWFFLPFDDKEESVQHHHHK